MTFRAALISLASARDSNLYAWSKHCQKQRTARSADKQTMNAIALAVGPEIGTAVAALQSQPLIHD